MTIQITKIDAFTDRPFAGNPAYQASSRGGAIRVRVAGDRVRLAGQAVTVLRATLSESAAAGAHQPVAVG